ncbi:UPF0147 family protein [Methanotorris formicicus]|uniref:UPF0147 protein MetfoDRAFT_1654 n=1 Tax=Methanotorris formicicus Mc-S-70 TaxID=647171 RepID=H1L0T0_9EURY|nr:UPF0147 family protein [Methanotorris formicicus]EHP84480.1 protein of unknown function UPF0147 [Methanotorris formicicus Mc-S-70]
MFAPKKLTPEEKLQQIAMMLDEIINDTTVPRNIRGAAEKAKETILKEGEEPIVKSATAIQILDDISDDPNMPLHTRTQIWSIVSELETVKNE